MCGKEEKQKENNPRKTMSDEEELEETIFIEVLPAKKTKKISYKDAPPRFMCERCVLWFNTPHKLTKHCLREHNQRPMYKCNYCGIKFKLLSHLRSHLNVHVGSEKFPCGYCDKKFVNESSRKRHIRNKVCQNSLESAAERGGDLKQYHYEESVETNSPTLQTAVPQ